MKSMSIMCLKGGRFLAANLALSTASKVGGASVPVHRRHQAGFSLVSAIFLLVVLAALGAFMVNFSGVQHTSAARDVLGARAYQAARSGIEWGAYQVLIPAFPANCPAAPTNLALAGTLAPFTVSVRCNRTLDTEGVSLAPNVAVYQLRANACNQPDAGVCPNTANPGEDYVERELQATFTDNP